MPRNLVETLADAARKLLRPIVRIMLRHGISHQTFAEYAKQAYVDVASEEFRVPGRKPSISRISVLTGLTRKDVSRLLHAGHEASPQAESYNRAARVIGTWVRDAAFHDAGGDPASLARAGAGGFGELVRSSAVDVPPRAVLDELVRVGAVAALPDGRLRLVNRAYVPHTGEAEKVEILGTDVADLASSIDHNMTHPPEEAFFQRKVAYDNLVASCLPELRARARAQGQRLLERLDRFMAAHDRDANPEIHGRGGSRAVLGIYYREEPKGDS